MRVDVNGVRIFFAVEGAKFVPDGPVMREKPTLILPHGGPGMDHTYWRPLFSNLADVAQVVYIHQRGCGRSDRRPKDAWTLAQWGDDVARPATRWTSHARSSADHRSVVK
jgi:proline iminopeptidase